MTTPTTPISLGDIQTEFGGSNPVLLSEYYRGGANVPAQQHTSATDGVAIPTSGTIRMGMFRGLDIIRLSISADTYAGYNIFTAAGSPTHPCTVVLTIGGFYVVAPNTGSYALTTGSGWHASSTILIVNNGVVSGRGGAGGLGGFGGNGGAGGAGGPAFQALRAVSIQNNSWFTGGGGGGGGGGGYFDGKSDHQGGGGGGGRCLGAGGSPGGGAASTAAPGGGATGYASAGGAGGNLAAGAPGGSPYYSGGGGGVLGACTSGNANITWLATGTRNGTLG